MLTPSQPSAFSLDSQANYHAEKAWMPDRRHVLGGAAGGFAKKLIAIRPRGSIQEKQGGPRVKGSRCTPPPFPEAAWGKATPSAETPSTETNQQGLALKRLRGEISHICV